MVERGLLPQQVAHQPPTGILHHLRAKERENGFLDFPKIPKRNEFPKKKKHPVVHNGQNKF